MKTFSESETYQVAGKRYTVTVQCTLFDDGNFTFHDEDDNPNFIFSGNIEHLGRVSAHSYCLNILSSRIEDYIANNKKKLNQQ